ncbi:glycosyltransferase family 4 protein [Parvularcula dongshanensis]|uniref:Glycosyltransferase involved in cell wall biosynthesis n=1 Tax=Parvularcula dongshanensis TaxID=1173995 RepID=A0A840I813_9PROT|nr:glycosyltransferase family 4 protein [Parvularcula dongshanensis]MBB4660304.1 glycosyltransferase involved in cell wall biosynthesis [Parvularcula dongshanensis]
MSLGYLLNTYPVTSGTFIRREIRAVEALGLPVTRYAVRRWDQTLVEPTDLEEQEATHYLLSGNAKGLGAALAAESARNPKGVAAASRMLGEIAKGTGGFVRPSAYLAEAAYLRQRTAREGVTHLHCHFGTNATAVALLCRLMGGPSYSFTVHGPDEWTDPESFRFDLKLEHAAFAIAISHYAKMQLMRWGGMQHRDKVHVARCGLQLSDFAPSPVPDSREFVCVGRLCPQKGQTLIPEAIEPLVADHPGLRVTLIGDGDTRPEIEAEVARRGLEDNVKLVGWQSGAEVRARLAAARALLLPSFAEGLPIVIMEAMALGRPALSTYIAGIPELLDEECGWIFPAGSVEHIRGAVRSCLESDADTLTAKGEEGRRRVEESHDIRQLAQTLEGLFKAQL